MVAFLNFPFKLGEDLIFGDRFCSAFFSEIFFPSTLCNQIFCPNFFNFILVGVIYPSFPICAITLTVFSFHGIQSANVQYISIKVTLPDIIKVLCCSPLLISFYNLSFFSKYVMDVIKPRKVDYSEVYKFFVNYRVFSCTLQKFGKAFTHTASKTEQNEKVHM